MNLKGTKTEANLQTAFAGESQARNKYTYYASKAKKEGYEQIAAMVLVGGCSRNASRCFRCQLGERYAYTDRLSVSSFYGTV